MKKNLLILLVLFTITKSFSQICGTPIPLLENLNQYSDIKGVTEKSTTLSSFCIDVQFHIIRNTDGSQAFTTPDSNLMINDLNESFNKYQIYFNKIGITYINNSNYVNIESRPEAFNLINNNNPNALNIYITDQLWQEVGGTVYGSSLESPSINFLIDNTIVETNILTHEVGHCFDLMHTYETVSGIELINGSNCEIAGDLICDTPADPGIISNPDNPCIYSGGGGYDPLENNFMSGYLPYCRNSFTQGQGIRMRNALSFSSVLQPILGSSCLIPELSGNNTICPGSNYTYNLTNGNSTTWNVSSNLQIITSSSSSCTVTPVNSTINEEGFIEVVLPFQTIRKTIWIGKPIINISRIEEYCEGRTHYITFQARNSEVDGFIYDWNYFPSAGFIFHDYGRILKVELPKTYETSSFELFLTATNYCGDSSNFYEEEIKKCGTFNNLANFLVNMNPNPADNFINLSIETNAEASISKSTSYSEIYNTEIYDIQGSLVYKKNIKKGENIISINNLKNGIYFVKVKNNDECVTKTLIIKK